VPDDLHDHIAHERADGRSERCIALGILLVGSVVALAVRAAQHSR
jgi:hypothetical protein